MKIITSEGGTNGPSLEVAEINPELHADLSPVVSDSRHQIAWALDVKHMIRLKPTGKHILRSGVVLQTAKLPQKRNAGYSAGLATDDSVYPASRAPGPVHELANFEIGLGKLQIFVTSSQLYEELLAQKRISKRKVAAKTGKVISELLGIVESLIPVQFRSSVKIFCALADVGEKLSDSLDKAVPTETANSHKDTQGA